MVHGRERQADRCSVAGDARSSLSHHWAHHAVPSFVACLLHTMPGLEPVGIINASEATANAVTNASMSAFDIAKRVLTFPSRLYARIRLIDELLQENAERQAESIAEQYRLAHPDAPLPVRGRHLTMPGPWAFFMSGYAVAVIILVSALLVV
jgi:hypothetical protein